MIRYRYMSADRKKLVKKNFSEILSLNTPEGKIKFMTATRALDSEWEAQMLDELKSDDELQKKYVAAVENEDSGKPLPKINSTKFSALSPLIPLYLSVFISDTLILNTTKNTCLVEHVLVMRLKLRLVTEATYCGLYMLICLGIMDTMQPEKYMGENEEFSRKK